MLIVRSQDKNNLIIDNCLYSLQDEQIYLQALNGTFHIRLAEYSTKEKAIKVLDMLEAFVNDDKALLHNLGYKQCIITDYSYCNIRYKLKSSSFQFPQDDEVKE